MAPTADSGTVHLTESPPAESNPKVKKSTWLSKTKGINLKVLTGSRLGGGAGGADGLLLRRTASNGASVSSSVTPSTSMDGGSGRPGARPRVASDSGVNVAKWGEQLSGGARTGKDEKGKGKATSGQPMLEGEDLGGKRTSVKGAILDQWPLYSSRKEDYKLGRAIGFGASSIVYLSTYTPPLATTSTSSKTGSTTPPKSLVCAIKVIDVDRLSRVGDIDRLRRETQLMALSKHANILRVRGEWMEAHMLYIAVRFMAPGSLLDIIRYAYPDGFEEAVIATVLKQALAGVQYLHRNNWIHRDLKASNFLLDDDGTVLLADFGVSALLFEDGHSPPASSPVTTRRDGAGILSSRKSFVGTPAWMAPEVAEGKPYDSKADIWSFGVTALELSSGRAPNSYYPLQQVLTKTILEDAPKLDRDGGKYKYSRDFSEFVASCLSKNPSGRRARLILSPVTAANINRHLILLRPPADKLLLHPFFKLAKRPSYLCTTILRDLPPIDQREQSHVPVDPHPHAASESSWNFGSTAPNSPSAKKAADPFANFSMSSKDGSMISIRELGEERRGISFDSLKLGSKKEMRASRTSISWVED